jgi:hypothetical protein
MKKSFIDSQQGLVNGTTYENRIPMQFWAEVFSLFKFALIFLASGLLNPLSNNDL